MLGSIKMYFSCFECSLNKFTLTLAFPLYDRQRKDFFRFFSFYFSECDFLALSLMFPFLRCNLLLLHSLTDFFSSWIRMLLDGHMVLGDSRDGVYICMRGIIMIIIKGP